MYHAASCHLRVTLCACVQVPLRGHSRREDRPLNMNHYANKKSAAESMLDVALLMANASQLKAVLGEGPEFTFYVPLITLISISLILQIVVGVLLIFIGTFGVSLQVSVRQTLLLARQHSQMRGLDKKETWCLPQRRCVRDMYNVLYFVQMR